MADYFIAAGGGAIGAGTYRGLWSNSQTWAVGDKVSPTQAYATAAARGYIYECTTGGAGGASEPTWVYTTPDTSTTTSSSAVFTCRNPDTWAKAGVYLDQGIQRALTAGDRIIIQYDGVPSLDAEVGADTGYYPSVSCSIIASTNSGTSTVTPTAMGTSNWIGNSTASRLIIFGTGAVGVRVYMYGITIRNASTTNKNLQIGRQATDTHGGDMICDNCYFWLGTTNSASRIIFGYYSVNAKTWNKFINCTFRFGATGQAIQLNGGAHEIEGGSISASGSTPTTLFTTTWPSADAVVTGMDLSLITGTLTNLGFGQSRMWFRQCKLGSGVTILAAPSYKGTTEIWVTDCDSGDNHYQFGFYDGCGSLTVDTSIYANDGATYDVAGNKLSWKIVTTAYASVNMPFVTPWITVHHEGTSAITPNFECVRSGSSTAYQNDEIWSEWLYKGTTGYTIGTIDRTDAMALAGTAADQTTGALSGSGWTGENATSWFGKLSPTSAITPAEIGDLCGRICVGEPSITVYVDPQIRGRT